MVVIDGRNVPDFRKDDNTKAIALRIIQSLSGVTVNNRLRTVTDWERKFCSRSYMPGPAPPSTGLCMSHALQLGSTSTSVLMIGTSLLLLVRCRRLVSWSLLEPHWAPLPGLAELDDSAIIMESQRINFFIH